MFVKTGIDDINTSVCMLDHTIPVHVHQDMCSITIASYYFGSVHIANTHNNTA